MIYRVVERGGLYQAQYRVLLFWWEDSIHAPSAHLAEQIRFASGAMGGARQSPSRVVWTRKTDGGQFQ